MASAIATERFTARNKVMCFAHDPADSTVLTDISWQDMRDYEEFTAILLMTALTGTGGVAFHIYANSGSTGGGTDCVIKTHATPTTADAEGDYLVLSATAEEIRECQVTATHGELRYVSAVVDLQNAADEAAVVYIFSGARFPRSGLTADVIA